MEWAECYNQIAKHGKLPQSAVVPFLEQGEDVPSPPPEVLRLVQLNKADFKVRLASEATRHLQNTPGTVLRELKEEERKSAKRVAFRSKGRDAQPALIGRDCIN